MIKELELRNVRLFGEKGARFRFPALTILCGTNSCGKSTVLKSLLLLRQSQGIREPVTVQPGRLRFVGSQVDLGSFSSLVTNHDVFRNMFFSISSDGVMPRSVYQRLANLSNPPLVTETSQEPEKHIDYQLRASFTFSGKNSSEDLFSKPSPNLGEEQDDASPLAYQGVLQTAVFEVSVDEEILLSWSVRAAATSNERSSFRYELLIPNDFYEASDIAEILELPYADNSSMRKAKVMLSGLLPVQMEGKIRRKEEDGEEQLTARGPLPTDIEEIYKQFRVSLRNIHYLGPLRSPAKRYYITNLDTVPMLDPEGEFLPYVLRMDKNHEVDNIKPGANEKTRESLSSALNEWLSFFRTGKAGPVSATPELEISTVKDILLELRLRSYDGIHPLADSGFGYSQLLPILVRGLLAPLGSLFVIEQPELHLNPALQVRLAEFLIAMSRLGKQVIVETHSEHVVNAVRVLAAEEDTGKLSGDCGIYFIDAVTGNIVIHELSIRPDGTVPEWPQHFFGEAASLTGRLLRVQKLRRQRIAKGLS